MTKDLEDATLAIQEAEAAEATADAAEAAADSAEALAVNAEDLTPSPKRPRHRSPDAQDHTQAGRAQCREQSKASGMEEGALEANRSPFEARVRRQDEAASLEAACEEAAWKLRMCQIAKQDMELRLRARRQQDNC